jgi:hypothetical protein
MIGTLGWRTLQRFIAFSMCAGGDSNVPLGFFSLTENLMMVAIAVSMLAA